MAIVDVDVLSLFELMAVGIRLVNNKNASA